MEARVECAKGQMPLSGFERHGLIWVLGTIRPTDPTSSRERQRLRRSCEQESRAQRWRPLESAGHLYNSAQGWGETRQYGTAKCHPRPKVAEGSRAALSVRTAAGRGARLSGAV